jgi:myosin heavy subunit
MILVHAKECIDAWKLTKPQDYNYLNQSGCFTVPSMHDAQDFCAIEVLQVETKIAFFAHI